MGRRKYPSTTHLVPQEFLTIQAGIITSSLVLTNHVLASWTKMFRILHAVHATGNAGETQTSEPLHVCGGEVVGESVQVQAEFPVAAVTKCVEVTRGCGDQGVVLATGDALHCQGVEAGDELWEGRLQDLVTQSQLPVAGRTKTVNLGERPAVRGER